MTDEHGKLKQLLKDLKEKPEKILNDYLDKVNLEGNLKVDSANKLTEILFDDYTISLPPLVLEEPESG